VERSGTHQQLLGPWGGLSGSAAHRNFSRNAEKNQSHREEEEDLTAKDECKEKKTMSHLEKQEDETTGNTEKEMARNDRKWRHI
jgi:hypothetical protein